MEYSAILLPVAGLIAGTLLGYFARRQFFCTLTSLEQYWYADNSVGIRTWAFAAVCAATFTQLLIFFGIADPFSSFYYSTDFGWLGAIVGGIAFGFGMALVGTCGFGALVRLGGGSLKSLMAITVLGLTAISTQRGLLSLSRTEFLDVFRVDFSFAGNQSIPNIAAGLTGIELQKYLIAFILLTAAFWILKDKTFRSNSGAVITSIVIGLVVSFGWFVTSNIASSSFDLVQVESASFVAPVGDTIMQFTFLTGLAPDYGVGMVIGTVLGAAIAARSADNVRWEACDDARELSRHILGAALMGFGGILAAGCTIGQGVSAASLFAISVPITIISILIGARLGLAWLIEGSVKAAFIR